MPDTQSKLQREEVQYQQTYDYTWEANLEQQLNNITKTLISLKGRGADECPPNLRAEIIAAISNMRFFLTKYNRDTQRYDDSLRILDGTTSIEVYDAVLSEIESYFALEAGYVLNFRAKTDKREVWEDFL